MHVKRTFTCNSTQVLLKYQHLHVITIITSKTSGPSIFRHAYKSFVCTVIPFNTCNACNIFVYRALHVITCITRNYMLSWQYSTWFTGLLRTDHRPRQALPQHTWLHALQKQQQPVTHVTQDSSVVVNTPGRGSAGS